MMLLPLDGLIFFPDPHVADPPPGVEERWIATEDGIRLHAWFTPAARVASAAPRIAPGVPGAPGAPSAPGGPSAAGASPAAGASATATAGPPADAPVVVWSHGNGGNIADREPVLLALAARGLDVLAYDYRGYGKSGGEPTEEGVYLDAQAAYDSLRARGVEARRIVCLGESLGGAVSIELATRRRCAGVAVVSTFTRLQEVGRAHYGPLARLAGDRFDALARIGKIGVPLFVAHGDRDEIVPFELGERLHAAAGEPKRFLRVAGYHHNDVFDSPALLDAIAGFAREVTVER